MRLAIAGKGGTGKTTISGTLARLFAREGHTVVAIDADTNPNLATMLGLAPDALQGIAALPRNLMERRTEPDGTTRLVFTADPEEILRQYGAPAPDGVQLIVMGKVHHGGAG
jgi:CO dehydrogenase maturation factor